MQQPHRVWEFRVASLDDVTSQDIYKNLAGNRMVRLQQLPVRAEYIIEAKGQGTRAIKKGLRMAAEDGITRPIGVGLECLSKR